MNQHNIDNVQILRHRLDMSSEAKICLHAFDVLALTLLKRLAMNSDLFGFMATFILLIRLKVAAWNVSADITRRLVQMILVTCVLHRAVVECVDVSEEHCVNFKGELNCLRGCRSHTEENICRRYRAV